MKKYSHIINNASSIGSLDKKMMFVLFSVFLTTVVTVSATTAYASSSSGVNCFERGIIDGKDHPFNQQTYSRCGGDYYEGFIKDCMSVDGNTMEGCESSTDA